MRSAYAQPELPLATIHQAKNQTFPALSRERERGRRGRNCAGEAAGSAPGSGQASGEQAKARPVQRRIGVSAPRSSSLCRPTNWAGSGITACAILIDTHALIWCAVNDAKLSRKARCHPFFLRNGASIRTAAASAWRDDNQGSASENGSSAARSPSLVGVSKPGGTPRMSAGNWRLMSITLGPDRRTRITPRAEHKDPFDRMLIAQAQADFLNMPIV